MRSLYTKDNIREHPDTRTREYPTRGRTVVGMLACAALLSLLALFLLTRKPDMRVQGSGFKRRQPTLNPQPSTLLKAGDAAYRRRDWTQAAAAYRQAVQRAESEGRKAKQSRDRQGAEGADANAPTHQLTNPPTLSQPSTNPSQPASQQWGEQAALAHFRLAYVYAQQKQYEKAIATFQELIDHNLKSQIPNPKSQIPLPERARYQIACCYRGMMREAEGEERKAKGETQNPKPQTHPSSLISHPSSRSADFYRHKAIEEFTRFIGHFPDGPLSHSAARAIADLNGGKLPERAGALYAHALRLEEKKRKEERLARAMCGPEALRWVLERMRDEGLEMRDNAKTSPSSLIPHLSSLIPSVAELARACGTTERGTTLYDLARVARAQGLGVSGVQATWEGLQQITPPAILLLGSHYIVLTRVDRRGITIVDLSPEGSQTQSERFLPEKGFKGTWQGYVLVIHGHRKQ